VYFTKCSEVFVKLLRLRKMYQPRIRNKNENWVYIYRNEAEVKNSSVEIFLV